MKTILRSLVVGSLALASGLLFVACDDVLADPTFKTWCGDKLCSWSLDSGSIRRAPTWHKNDLGVELVDPIGGTTQISQKTDRQPKCLEIIMVADVDPAAQVGLGLEFNADGSIEFQQPIVASGFHEVKTQVTPPAAYQGIRFTITKRGAGRAVLAQIRVKEVDNCTAPPIVLRDQRLGTQCSGAAADECLSKVCNGGRCAECRSESECGVGETCEARKAPYLVSAFGTALPTQCSPGRGLHTPGDECLADDDCTSGACDGEEIGALGLDGGQLTKCPIDFPAGANTDASVDAGEGCLLVLVRGGRCR